MHDELEQVGVQLSARHLMSSLSGREAYLRELVSQWRAVTKKMRSHRSYHGEMDQIRKEAQDKVIQKEKKTV